MAIVRDHDAEMVDGNVQLSEKEATTFRALAARANYLSLDRPDIQFATKEICRDMARPTASSMRRMKRLARYLLQHPRTVVEFGHESRGNDIDVYSDSDWAGCLRTRRSTSGGIVTVNGGALKHWSSTQATVAQSSGEAEYYALVRAAAEGLGMQSVMKDLGWDAAVVVWIDSSAAKSIASRVGLGKVRHMEVKFLWLQEAVKAKRVEVRKIAGNRNPSDVLTKPKSLRENEELLKRVGVTVQTRREKRGCAGE